MPLGSGREGVAGEQRRKRFPVKAHLLKARHQGLNHEDAGFAHDLEFVGQPGADFPSDEKGAKDSKAGFKDADAGGGLGQR